MFGTHDIALFIAAELLLNITPGADFLFILGRERRGGLSQQESGQRWRGSGLLRAHGGRRARALRCIGGIRRGVHRSEVDRRRLSCVPGHNAPEKGRRKLRRTSAHDAK